ncbi:P-loop containing nucleoside triphosphate hydrolase protein [Lactarius psammicola]|nr:P-loop containing nucleoside triphosphate hydrolase protein [Lactarius psammicola]
MDEEDEYGIPHDYYSSEGSFQIYQENFPPSSFDGHLEDTLGDSQRDSFGDCEWSWNPLSGSPSRAPSEPDDIGQFDDDTPDHRGLAGGPFLQHSPVLLHHQVSRESDLSTTYRTTSHSFREQQNTVTNFSSGPVQNAHTNRMSSHKQKSRFDSDMQRSPLDSRAKGGNDPRICNPDGIRLRDVSELPTMYRAMFKFATFNAMQSSCFNTIMKSEENVVVSAPTGSGKTVLFELSIIHMLVSSLGRSSAGKCVYMAPTKALCAERTRDWTEKFGSLGIRCCEFTGDTVQPSKSVWGDVKDTTIIITTAEKWDSLTRNWSTHSQLLSQIQLFLIDEVHILNELRGSTLEVVVSRMKTRGSAVRFVAVSATVPNIDDVARWISSRHSNGAAATLSFGEEYRPCQLSRFVYGFPRGKNQNDFLFARSLNYRLFPLLQQHSANKPILIFVSTRKGVLDTAEQLMVDYYKAVNTKHTVPWSPPKRIERTFQNKQLEKLAAAGIGAHHAGLELQDKRLVEELFTNRVLRVVVATSTLAVGVNLPAHIVVIKDVKIFQNGASQEYSDLDIMQMIGRAGRPQFDKEGVAIIMCESGLESKYRALGQGQTILESSLHTNLAEHLNSEIGLGTITNIVTAKEWLRNSFMFRRMAQNPQRYMPNEQNWQDGLNSMIMQCVNCLRSAELLSYVEGCAIELRSTEFGDIMSKYYIKQATMALIMNLPIKATLREMVYNKLEEHIDIRFRTKRVEKAADKVFLLIQAILGKISLHATEYKSGESSALLDSLVVFRHASRIARAMVEVAIAKRNGAQIKHGLELARNISARVWEDRPSVLCQIETIGEKSKILAENGITNFDKLRAQDPNYIDMLLNKKQPSGHKILFAVRELPRYSVTIDELSVAHSTSDSPIDVELDIQCSVSLEGASTKSLQESKSFSVTAQLTKPSQSICVYMSSDAIAGVTISSQYKPQIDVNEFPVADTRPMTDMEMVLDGLEDNDDFWNIAPSDDEILVLDSNQGHLENKTKDRQDIAQHPRVFNTDKRADKENCLTRPEKLPNGRYRCNHPCKDKSSCRHLCCRDGVKRPPPLSRQRSIGSQPRADPSNLKTRAVMPDDSQKSRRTSLPKASTRRLDANLRQLEALHKSSGTDSHMGISGGKRIKLSRELPGDNTQPLDNTTKKWPRLDTDFSALEEDDGKSGKSGDVRLFDLSDSDELPDLHELVRARVRGAGGAQGNQPSCNSDYSDPDMDAMIRDAHLEGITPTGTDAAGTQNSSTSGHVKSVQLNPPSKRKRSIEVIEDLTTTQVTVASSPNSQRPRFRPQKRRLEVEAHPCQNSESNAGLDFPAEDPRPTSGNFSAGKEDLVLDRALFHVVDSEETRYTPVVPSPCRPPSLEQKQQLPTLDFEEPSFYIAWKAKQKEKYGEDWSPVPTSLASRAPSKPERDHLAEFEEWLATTDSIEIVG